MNQAQRQIEEQTYFTSDIEFQDAEHVLRQKEFTQKFVPTACMNLKILAKTYRVWFI